MSVHQEMMVIFTTILVFLGLICALAITFASIWGWWLDGHRTPEDDAESDREQIEALRKWEREHPNARRLW